MSSANFSQINEAINLLIDIKNIIRQEFLSSSINEQKKQKIKDNLIQLNKLLIKLNEIYDIKNQFKTNIKSEIINIQKDDLIIVNSPKNRKKLIDYGIPSFHILATGGLIHVDDIKILNPDINEKAILGINNKIEKFWHILEARINQSNFRRILLLLEELNIADKVLLKRKDIIQKKLPIPVEILIISSFDNLNDQICISFKL